MNIENTPFMTRARTVDHLGREQIADCPTAISELWKNSYDAYARKVELNVFDGLQPVAALIDNGHGMDKGEFINKWLVIGTESKATGQIIPEEDRFGLPIRPKQGQKGIGRLSCAAMGSLLLLISKRVNKPFVAALIDWRIFENPFLLLPDIRVPVVEFSYPAELNPLLTELYDALMSNVFGSGKENEKERDLRIVAAWQAFNALEIEEGRLETTQSLIVKGISESEFTERHFACWPAWNGDCPSGTALFVSAVSDDVRSLLSTESLHNLDGVVEQAKRKFFETLSCFIDPYSNCVGPNKGDEFSYAVLAKNGFLSHVIIDHISQVDTSLLSALEHTVNGYVDEDGIFTGTIRVFGRDIENVKIKPPSDIKKTRLSQVGPFDIQLGTYETDFKNSTHTQEFLDRISEFTNLYGGLRLYRDSLRVMPYGREENDFFQIEKRRSMHAGRYFWSARRLFGRISLSREGNPNLKDKAGREGLIDNKASKQFREIVINILVEIGRKYLGTESENRRRFLPEINAEKARQKALEGRKKLLAKQRKELRSKLKDNGENLVKVLSVVEETAQNLASGTLLNTEADTIALMRQLSELSNELSELTLGSPPSSLGSLEEDYREYRRKERKASSLLTSMNESVAIALERFNPKAPEEIVYNELQRNAAYLHSKIRKWSADARSILNEELKRIIQIVEDRNKAYHDAVGHLPREVEEGKIELKLALAMLDDIYHEHQQINKEIFSPYIAALQSLSDQIDLEGIVAHSLRESDGLREEVKRLNSLAQLGITVEIIGHEIESLDMTIERGLASLAESIKTNKVFESIVLAHNALSDRMKFLSPLKLSGQKIRRAISGGEIYRYVYNFFEESINRSEINFQMTESFEKFSVIGDTSLIYPVFVNLVNNARYWVRFASGSDKKILLNYQDGRVIVADNGPGVDEDDVEQLFTLFFTRKSSGGRGVGLYLCRINLAAGGHVIHYERDPSKKVLSGANFVIEFKGK